MACCLCFFLGSKTCIVVSFLAIPIFALFAICFSSAFLVTIITLSLLLILFSPLFRFTISKQTPNTILINEPPIAENDKFSPQDENTLIVVKSPTGEENKSGFSIGPEDLSLCLESESLDQSSSEEDRFSDIEWPYNMSERLDCSDGSISDEESLIEIAIPSGQFVSQRKMFKYDELKCCSKLCADSKDFLADISEEDNLIEIDIYMGSIKCSKFVI
ncbi:hypothetical protein CASFOL_040999 [Castilleja foliolosa]|uniref:Transmembrane protein n=1 Tax=Castilleja foliolosa TaxID=1961234 RepID=A0ABD3BD89_9LAMI